MVVKTADETQPLMKAQERGMPKGTPFHSPVKPTMAVLTPVTSAALGDGRVVGAR